MQPPTHTMTAERGLPMTMTAILQDCYGPPETLRLGATDRPEPRDDEVLIAVRAAGVSRGVLHLLTGMPRLVRIASGLRHPRASIPGMDVCGHIVRVGSAVRELQVGQRVLGIARGSFAPYAVAKATHVVRAPDELTDAEATVLAESGLTALQALQASGLCRDFTDSRPAEGAPRVLVIGASGGVGSFAVKLAALSGADVTAVCSAGKADFVTGWGAARVIDYRTEDALASADTYDVILDGAGGAPLSALRAALRPRGVLVFIGNETGGAWTGGYGRPFAYQMRMAAHSERFVNLLARTNARDLTQLAEHAQRDGLRPHVHATFPLAQVTTALDELASGMSVGKIALTLTDEPETTT